MKYHVIASGQPAAYKDTIWHVRLTFDNPVDEDEARRQAAEGNVGYTDKLQYGEPRVEGWWQTYLEFFRQVDEEGKVWEFKTVSPYTD